MFWQVFSIDAISANDLMGINNPTRADVWTAILPSNQ
jgi:hypothetical protein